ncbi:hypothetical protein pb186bvf_004201 [Paramecium bursaria]
MLQRLLRFRFSNQIGTKAVAQADLPIHLRAYDAKKYEVPSTKIKVTTGFAFLDVEPMPRARIMKLCYLILDKLRKEIPAEVIYRVYTEEKIKYIMRVTDQIEDIHRLEQEFGHYTIEKFIQALAGELELVDHMKYFKPWNIKNDDQSYEILKQRVIPQKFEPNIKPPREQQKFIN